MTLKPEHIVEALNKKTFDEIDPDEVLKHYGYKPEEVRCNGVGIGVWRKEEAFQKLGDIGAFMRFVDHKAKARIEFNYDPGLSGGVAYYTRRHKDVRSVSQKRAFASLRKTRRRFKVLWRCPANLCGFKAGCSNLFKDFPCVLFHFLTSCYTFRYG